jgi:hypothetical protein
VRPQPTVRPTIRTNQYGFLNIVYPTQAYPLVTPRPIYPTQAYYTQAPPATMAPAPAMTKRPLMICNDDPQHAQYCTDPKLDCSIQLIKSVCRRSCNQCPTHVTQNKSVQATTTKQITTTIKTTTPKPRTKCSLSEMNDLNCEQECIMVNSVAKCACWTGYITDKDDVSKCNEIDNCPNSNCPNSCINYGNATHCYDPEVSKQCEQASLKNNLQRTGCCLQATRLNDGECSITVETAQTMHVTISNKGKECFGTKVGPRVILASFHCVNNLGATSTSPLEAKIIRTGSSAPTVTFTKHSAKTSKVFTQYGLALVTISQPIIQGAAACRAAEIKAPIGTGCVAVGYGTSRQASFAKIAQLNDLEIVESEKCRTDLMEEYLCIKSKSKRLSDLDIGSGIMCEICTSCSLYYTAIVISKLDSEYGAVLKFNTFNNDIDKFTGRSNKPIGDSCFTNPLTTTTKPTTTTTATTTTLSTTSTTTIITTTAAPSSPTATAAISSQNCCPLVVLDSPELNINMIFMKQPPSQQYNLHPVYYNHLNQKFVWYTKYQNSMIWIISDQVGSKSDAIVIGNSPDHCPEYVPKKKWLGWSADKWMPNLVNFKCSGEQQPERTGPQWQEWMPWSFCSFKNCDGKEKKTRVRYCQTQNNEESCIGTPTERVACSVQECKNARNICCKKLTTNLTIKNETAEFHFDQVLYGNPVYRHIHYHDIFMYKVLFHNYRSKLVE